MPKKFTLIFAAIIVLILGIGAFLVLEPFRNDTQTYVNIKNETKTSIQSGGNDQTTKSALIKANDQFTKVKCQKVDQSMRTECERLKSDISSIRPMLDDDAKLKSAEAQNLAKDIVNTLKK